MTPHTDAPTRLQRILDVLIEAVVEGGAAILKARLAGDVDSHYKDETELVTKADELSNVVILARFRQKLPVIDPEIAFQLEESGMEGTPGNKIAGADPLDGTNHFNARGQLYSVQAHYVEDCIPLCGVVLQPKAFLPLSVTNQPVGRMVQAIRGHGAYWQRTAFLNQHVVMERIFPVEPVKPPTTRSYVACVPISTKMGPEERARALRVLESGVVSSSTGAGGAGANVLMTIFGGQHVYANFGAGEDLDLIPPQVIAEEAGLTVWGLDRKPPVWREKKQPFVVAPSAEIAEAFFHAAGL